MANPTLSELVTALSTYVNTSAGENTYVQSCTEEAVAFIGQRFNPGILTIDPPAAGLADYIAAPLERMPVETYTREVMELGADLFYRRQAQNGIVSVNALEGTIARVSRDPWAAAELRLTRWLGLGFA